VLRAVEAGKEIEQIPLAELKAFSELISEDVFETLSLERTLKSKSQVGGTSPELISATLAQARESLKD
jgi:argininosuccinate lyase